MGRPLTFQPISSKYSRVPSTASRPLRVKTPVSGTSIPILTGAGDWAAPGQEESRRRHVPTATTPATTRFMDGPPPPPWWAARVAQVCYSHAVLTVRGVPLEVVERGQGRQMLWLHGEEGLDPQAPFLDLLAGTGRVVAPSHPGFGHSPESSTVDTVDDLARSEEHTSELQSRPHLVCRLLLEKKKDLVRCMSGVLRHVTMITSGILAD